MNSPLQDYKVFPRHVGAWEGSVRVLDADLQQIKQYKIAQQFKQAADRWILINTFIFADGNSMTHTFDIIPTGRGEVVVKTEEPSLKTAKMDAIEHGDSIIDFKLFSPETGRLTEIETINLISDRERFRTTQLFSEKGEFKGLLVVTEHKVESAAS